MRWENLYIAGTGAFLPPEVGVPDEVAAGRYDAESAAFTGQLAVTVAADGESTAELAVRAGRQALARAGLDEKSVGSVFHCSVLRDGPDVWNSAAYVQKGVAAAGALPVELGACSNSALVGMEVAAAYVTARPDTGVALVTAADQWNGAHFDRWRSDRFLYGDAGAAVLLSQDAGQLQVLSLATTSDPELEGLHRGTEPPGGDGDGLRLPVDIPRRAGEFTVATGGGDLVWQRLVDGVRATAAQALAEAETMLAEVDRIVVPHLGRHLIEKQYLRPLAIPGFERTTWEFARRVGHGAADPFAGLNHLCETGALARGATVLVLGIGAGFTWSASVLRAM